MVLNEYSAHFSCFKCFSTPSEENFKDTASKDVVQEGDIDNEARGFERGL